jgi:transcriptional regulator with XRE-family HTH domain
MRRRLPIVTNEEVAAQSLRIAQGLKARREELGLSKNLLSQMAGVSVQTVAFIESGTNSPSLATFMRLCEALGIDPSLLLRQALGDGREGK